MGTKHYMPTFKPHIFQPSDIGGLVLWVKSDSGVTKGGDNRVSNWADNSGVGNNLAQGTASKQPLWMSNQINGYPAIYFVKEVLIVNRDQLASSSYSMDQPFSAFVVANATYSSGSVLLNFGDPYYDYANFYCYDSQPPKRMSLYAGGGTNNCILPYAYDVWAIFTGVFDASNSIIRINGAEDTGNAGGLGCSKFVVPIDLTVYVAEIVVYNSVLSNSNRQKVENYLNGRYAIY